MRRTTHTTLTGKAAGDPSSESPPRFAEAVQELLALHALFQSTRGGERPLLYAQCIPWLSEVKAHTKPPLPVREIVALVREVDWHLRSLAGLGTGNSSNEAHAAWALGGLEALAERAGPR